MYKNLDKGERERAREVKKKKKNAILSSVCSQIELNPLKQKGKEKKKESPETKPVSKHCTKISTNQKKIIILQHHHAPSILFTSIIPPGSCSLFALTLNPSPKPPPPTPCVAPCRCRFNFSISRPIVT